MPAFVNIPLLRWLPVGLFILIASHHFYRVHTAHLSPWLGGGFGMFSTTDYGPSRYITVHGLRDNIIEEVIEIPRRLSGLTKKVRGLPDDSNLLELAGEIKTHLVTRQHNFPVLRITVWSTSYHPKTLQPTFTVLNRINYATVLARISHNFRSEEPQGCVVTRRAKVWARKRTCSTLSTQIECNAVNARYCGSAVESL